MTVVAQAVNDLPTIKRPAGANLGNEWAPWRLSAVAAARGWR
jgi:hypothetical protein